MPTPSELDAIYDEAAEEWDVHPHLLRAVAGQESGGTRDPDRAVSRAGARGRMQLMPKTAIGLGVTDTSDPRQNIFAGAKYLSEQLDKYGRVDHALAAYNAGPGRVDDYLAGRGGLPDETRAYVPAVTRRYQALAGTPRQPAGDAVSRALGVDASGTPTGPVVSPAPAPVSGQPDPYSGTVGGGASKPAPDNDPYGAAIGPVAGPAQADADPYTSAIGTPQPAPASTAPPTWFQDVKDTLGVGTPAAAPAAHPLTETKPRPLDDRLGPVADRADGPAAAASPADKVAALDLSKLGPTTYEVMAQRTAADRAADSAKTVDQRVTEAGRNALAPEPNTYNSPILPVAFPINPQGEKAGPARLALPSSVRDMLEGLFEASQGPATGTMTPAATGALAGVMMGGALNPSVARGSGAAIGGRTFGQGRNEAPDYLGADFRAAPTASQNALAGSTTAPGPTSPVPGIAPPAAPAPVVPNPLAGAAPPPAPMPAAGSSTPANVNLLSGAPAPDAPRNPFLPIVTQNQAAARVDNLLAHFGKGGNVDPAGSPLAGSPTTLAQSTGNAGYAALENGLRSTDSHFNNLWTAKAKERAQARNQAYQTIAGEVGDVEAAEAARDAATSAARQAAFANARPVDAAPFVDTVNGILAGPDGKRDAVTRSLEPLLRKAQNAAGNGLETDPAQLYGVRKAINDQLGSVGTQEGADARAATRQLMQARDALDSVIESGAPGFRDYIAQHAELSRPIDGQRWLQAQNVTDQQGNIVLGKLDSAIKRLDAQRGRPGASMADGVTDEQIAQMRILRDDMRREAATNATKPIGSTTVQNLATSSVLAGAKGIADGSALVGALTGGGVGGVPGVAVRLGLNKLTGRGEALVQAELRNRLLNPLAGTPMPAPGANPLAASPVYYNTRP